jgi:hypothetical protein
MRVTAPSMRTPLVVLLPAGAREAGLGLRASPPAEACERGPSAPAASRAPGAPGSAVAAAAVRKGLHVASSGAPVPGSLACAGSGGAAPDSPASASPGAAAPGSPACSQASRGSTESGCSGCRPHINSALWPRAGPRGAPQGPTPCVEPPGPATPPLVAAPGAPARSAHCEPARAASGELGAGGARAAGGAGLGGPSARARSGATELPRLRAVRVCADSVCGTQARPRTSCPAPCRTLAKPAPERSRVPETAPDGPPALLVCRPVRHAAQRLCAVPRASAALYQ